MRVIWWIKYLNTINCLCSLWCLFIFRLFFRWFCFKNVFLFNIFFLFDNKSLDLRHALQYYYLYFHHQLTRYRYRQNNNHNNISSFFVWQIIFLIYYHWIKYLLNWFFHYAFYARRRLVFKLFLTFEQFLLSFGKLFS